jgi:hypothetical protein
MGGRVASRAGLVASPAVDIVLASVADVRVGQSSSALRPHPKRRAAPTTGRWWTQRVFMCAESR